MTEEMQIHDQSNQFKRGYNIAAIRNLLREAFTAQDLVRFCTDRPNFRSVPGHFAHNASLEEMIDVVIDRCQVRELFPELLSEVQEYNPRQYAKHATSLDEREQPPEPRRREIKSEILMSLYQTRIDARDSPSLSMLAEQLNVSAQELGRHLRYLEMKALVSRKSIELGPEIIDYYSITSNGITSIQDRIA